MPRYSLIIPAFNEEARLGPTLEAALRYFQEQAQSLELLVVDDGSLDRTRELVAELARENSTIKLISYQPNRGKGYAVRCGMLEASGELLLFADADGSTPIEEVQRLEKALTEELGFVIGSRALVSPETRVRTVWYRRVLGRVFNFLVNWLALRGVADSQCGFKLFRRDVARDLFGRQKLNGFSFDVELLFLARKLGYSFAEVAVNWTNMPGSKVNLLKDSLKMLRDIVKMRIWYLRGSYGDKSTASKTVERA